MASANSFASSSSDLPVSPAPSSPAPSSPVSPASAPEPSVGADSPLPSTGLPIAPSSAVSGSPFDSGFSSMNLKISSARDRTSSSVSTVATFSMRGRSSSENGIAISPVL